MASSVNAALCALVGTVFWSVLGYAIMRPLLPRALACGAAAVVGWAVFSAVTLPISVLIGFSAPAVVIMAVLGLALAAAALRTRAVHDDAVPTPAPWSYALAAALALVPTSAILPKFTADGVHVADPMLDHAKAALIDAMTRQGVPPVNPVFGELGAASRLVYYYLWHFSAAELALPLRVSGWEADIGLTWFTAFASLALMMGAAVWLSRRSSAAVWVVVLAAAGSLWLTLGRIFHAPDLAPVLLPPIGMAGWLFQATWVPQHLMSASCAIAALLFAVQCVRRQSLALLLTLALVVVAGFESSTYVGGVTFAITTLIAAPILLAAVDPGRRVRFALGLLAAAALALALAAPFIRDQLASVAARGTGPPIVIHHVEVLGGVFPQALRRALDLPAYWLILLPIELPAAYVAGVLAVIMALRRAQPDAEKLTVAVLACLAGAGLGASWLLMSTLGDNNDLALRAIIPAEMILIVAAAAALTLKPRPKLIAAAALGGLILSLPATLEIARYNFRGRPQPDEQIFAQTPQLWAAVRRYAAPTARIANNPLFLKDLTPWPVNLSWALLSDRGSCFAGREMVLPYATLPAERREAINAQFIRVFAGQGSAGDVDDMANKYGCDVIVVVPQDGAWISDPFAASSDYRLAENQDGRWRIYVRR